MNDKEMMKIYKWGEEFSKFSPRIPGTDNMEKARDYIITKLENFGLTVSTEPINFRGVFFSNWELRIISPKAFSLICCPQNNVGFGEVETEIIDIRKGRDKDYQGKDVEGKIVLINWGTLTDHEIPCGTKKRYPLLASYDRAFQHGAAGMIGYFMDTPGNALKILEPGIKPTGGSNISGPAEIGPHKQYQFPVLTIGKKDAFYLKKLLSKGPVKAKLKIEGKRKVSTTWTIIGRLKGWGKHSFLIGSHYCSTFEGAICDTVGVVGALALAEKFSNVPLHERPKTIYFIFSGSHVWLNCNVSSTNFIKNHPDIISKSVAMLWMDHISNVHAINGREVSRRKFPLRVGITSDNLILFTLTFFSMLKNKRFPLALPLSRLWTFCEMGPFDNIGIPVMCQQVLGEFMLTTEDTWDKINPEQLYRDISVYETIARWIQGLPGTLLKRFEFRGRSFFGCGVLFPLPSSASYGNNEQYIAEKAPPLIRGGFSEPLRQV
ncbi:MAG: hypothetical protein ACTSU4_01345 [Promethearchaeota archaeon]